MRIKISEYAFKFDEEKIYEVNSNEEIKVLNKGGMFSEKPVFKIIAFNILEDSLEFKLKWGFGQSKKYNIIKQLKNGERNIYCPIKNKYSLEVGELFSITRKPPKQKVFDAVHGYKISIENE